VPDSQLALWNRLYKTPKEHLKPFTRAGGFKGTSIKPMYAIMRATEEFGPCGQGWGWDVHETRVDEGMVFCLVSVWYKIDGERCQTGAQWGGTQMRDHRGNSSDECFKMSITDAVTKCLTYIGIGADVHMGQHDGDKYQAPTAAPGPAPKTNGKAPTTDPVAAAKQAIEKATDPAQMDKLIQLVKVREKDGTFTEDQAFDLNKLIGSKMEAMFK